MFGNMLRVIVRRVRLNARWLILIGVLSMIHVFRLYWNLHLYEESSNLQFIRPTQHVRVEILNVDKETPKPQQNVATQDTEVSENTEPIKCSVSSRRSAKILNPQSVSGMTDWTFTQKQHCVNFSITDLPEPSTKLGLDCGTSLPNVSGSGKGTGTSLYSVNFGDPCLSSYIDKCCRDMQAVPNIIHYVWFGTKQLGFFNFLSLMSSLRFQKPCLMLIHGPTVPHGVYWEYFLRVFPNIVHVYRESPTEIFGNKLRFKEHASDIMRIEALISYGGIYLDFDELILRSLDSLRKYNHTQGHELFFTMGSQLVMSKKNTTFLQLWYKSYRDDYRKIWAYNALWVPNGLQKKYPDLIHVEGYNFTRPSWKNTKDIYDFNYDWSTNYGMHMYARWYRRPIDLTVIRTLNTTVGSVSRHILFGNKEICHS